MSTEQDSTGTAGATAEKQKEVEASRPKTGRSKPASDPGRKEKVPASGRRGGVLGSLALLIALAALGATGYQYYQQWQSASSSEPVEPPASQASVQDMSTQLGSRLDQLGDEINSARQAAKTENRKLDSEIEKLSRDSVALLNQLSELGRTDRDDWQLAEVEYLLRMAYQRVVMGGELNSAASLLANADNILSDLNMAGLHQVRRQVARDLAAVKAASQLDSEGIYLRLQALQDQAATIPFYGLPQITAPEASAAAEEGEDWQSTLAASWAQAVAKFKTLVVVQKQEGEVKPLLSEAWQALVRERLALLLDQAKTAVILQQQTVYKDALDDAQQLVAARFLQDSPATRSVLAELAALEGEEIVADLPDISASQEAIRAYIDQKYQAQEQVAPLADEKTEAG